MSAPAPITLGCKSAQGTSNGDDRLSSLPDAMLHHMTSFLPMPEVVRTSLLSPRWRYLWTSTPFIHIDHLDFQNDIGYWIEVDMMEKFVDQLLFLRDKTASLDEARIFISHSDNGKSFAWIHHALKA
ncbi:hypothetical protein QYE76_049791 [Lolium multiflorum]|uniref:F-box domain-containing protein n=1 Tax=Lolium multiflorum TaxID=4521 RepID=A0AAD8SNP2_LOLMU|nr:hypothetical protein QYE76_049791 [Lolium multiflorum]